MRRWLVALAVVTPFFVPQSTSAQSIDDGGGWLAFFGRGDIESETDGLKWWFDGHMRFFDNADGFGQSIVRPGIGYALDENFTLWGGYGWIRTSPNPGDDFDEHRFWEQLTWSVPIAGEKIGFRSRLEQRVLDTGNDTGLRFRQLVSFRKQLPCLPRHTLVVWDELFIHLNDTDWGASAGFDQNRIFVGFGVKHREDSRWRVEVGYLNQHLDRRGRNDLTNHLISINLYRSP